MTKFDSHLCLVSAQATPNLLPILDESWRPDRVVLACSKEMKNSADLLRSVIKNKCPSINVELLDLPNAYDYAALCDAFLAFLADCPDENIALNVTGGTKLMAVAAQEVFRSEQKQVFYVNVETDEVITLGRQTANQPLHAKLKVREMLEVHGYSVNGQDKPQVTRVQSDLTSKLIGYVSTHGRALGQFNWLAYAAQNTDLSVRLDAQQRDNVRLLDIVELFEQAGLLNWSQDRVTFCDDASRVFANGGWLESHVYSAIQSIQGKTTGISDVVQGLRVASGSSARNAPSQKTKQDTNEIDVAFLYRNTLHLIECKTANLAQDGQGGDTKATEAIYKMESLLKFGGLRTKAMIVDYRGELSRSRANLERAKEARVEIVSGDALLDLKAKIKQIWLSA